MTAVTSRAIRRPVAALTVLLATAFAVLIPSAAQAHSLDSSTISTRVTDDGVDATVTVALATLDEAMGTDYASSQNVDGYADAITGYLADHLTVTAADGTVWGETFSDLTRESVEGIDSISVDVTFDTGGSDTSSFELAYDAVIEAVSNHEAVVVLTDSSGSVSTAGVITTDDATLAIADAAASGAADAATGTGIQDMIGYGFDHVLEGADHLLFLTTLLLVAPVVIVAGRWRRRTGVLPTARGVLGVVTSFTVGHSITLIASALGWVNVPTRPVEVLVAVSVGVAAVHAVRPLVRHGENLIAAGFGLVHGLAFAGILVDLGLDGSTSLPALLAFNVGVELAQLVATALVFPSLYLLSRTRYYPAVRITGAAIALTAATGWVVDRLGILANPLDPVETAAIHHPWIVVATLATLAAAAWVTDRRRGPAGHASGATRRAVPPQPSLGRPPGPVAGRAGSPRPEEAR